MAAKSRTMAQQKTKEAYCFIVPAFIYMILVLGYPIVYNIILSLKDVNVKNLKSGTSVFVGLQNYIDLFHDPTFLLVLRNTFIFTIACLIFQFTVTHLEPHRLPLIGRADWNDCLNLNCFSAEPGEPFQTTGPSEGPVAESIFIAAMFVKYGKEYAAICRRRGNEEEAVYAEKEVEKVYQAVLDAGWDGEWFLRAYDAAGEKVGSNECEEGKIYIEPQGFCVLAEIGVKEGLAEKALTSVQNILETKYGVVLLQPAYTKYYLNLGEVSSYPPGYKENAGIFCHNNPWISIAETVVGHGNRAFDLYRKICPAYIEDISEIHRTEPYVYSQMIAGKDAAHFGEAKNSWLTGTAAWTFVNVSQYILGIQPDYDGLTLNPCIPSDMEEFKIRRYFRGAWYNITFQNPEHREKGISSLTVNGTAVEGNLIPLTEGCTEYDVVAVM